MTDKRKQEAGALGGAATHAKHGTAHYQEMGRRGGVANLEKGSDYFSEIGRKGGLKSAEAGLRERGIRGGAVTSKRYGPEHFQNIGRKGAEAQRRTKARTLALEKEVAELRTVGAQMANACFNMAQMAFLDEPTRTTMDELRRKWDAIHRVGP